MAKRLKYELIENESGRTLVSGSTSHSVLEKAAQYCRDNDLSYYDVSYIVIKNGSKATTEARLTGAALQELIEDMEIVDEYGLVDDYGDEDDEW